MACEKIREKFSSLFEGDLTPFEEKMIKEHLSSCPGCQKEFEAFKKTMSWLHSVDQVEAPDGFLTEIYQKMEDRRRTGTRHGWVHWVSRMNLPAQAVAMVAIVFVVLYITKMIPMETSSPKKVDKPLAYHVPSGKKTKEAITAREVAEKGGVEEKKDQPVETPTTESKAPLPEEKRADRTMLARESPSPASISAPIQEIVLRTSDPAKSLSELRAMVKQFGGEILKEEENVLLASLPTSSLSEFSNKMEQRSISKKTEEAAPQTGASRALNLSPKAKEEVSVKEKEMGRPMADQLDRVTVRIIVIKE